MDKKKYKLVKFLEENVLDKVIKSNKASTEQKQQASNVKRLINGKNYTAISVVMYFYHSIINRKDVGDELQNNGLPTFESVMKKFDKIVKETFT